MSRSLTFVLVLVLGCASDELAENAFAIDTDGNGAVDCADIDYVLACVHHSDSHVCAHADVNGDGNVDDADVHDLHTALAGHHCAAPDHHETDGHHSTDHDADHASDHTTADHDADGLHDPAVH